MKMDGACPFSPDGDLCITSVFPAEAGIQRLARSWGTPSPQSSPQRRGRYAKVPLAREGWDEGESMTAALLHRYFHRPYMALLRP